MAATTLIDNAVRVTITHSDSAATASEAATAFVNLDDATRTDFNWKPIPETCDRIMVVNPRKAANHRVRKFSGIAVKIAAWGLSNVAEARQYQGNQGVIPDMPAIHPQILGDGMIPKSMPSGF